MPPRAQLSPFLRGVVYGLFLAGSSYQEIAEEVAKEDGGHPCQQTVAATIRRVEKNGGLAFDGGRLSQAGRPRSTETALDRQILRLVFKHRGRAVVTAQYVQKMIRAARKVSIRAVQRRLSEAGLAWLRRRRKSIVPQAHKVARADVSIGSHPDQTRMRAPCAAGHLARIETSALGRQVARLDFAAWTLARTAATLARWAYTDGTVFFLARDNSELESHQRGALGPHVWRQADGSDGLYEECIGPSAYWKAQGHPVRIWGLLVAGVLFIYIMPQGETMNRWWYEWIINHKFPAWLRKAIGGDRGPFLVQDHERCLWAEEPRCALREQGIHLLEHYPRCSQDLNAIEAAWREVRARLAATEPDSIETRDQFIVRLRAAVAWVNVRRRAYL
ncbi:unnamed protein product, partial [Prorocentrum cordatum]